MADSLGEWPVLVSEVSRDGPFERFLAEDLDNELSLDVSSLPCERFLLLLKSFFKLPPKDLDFFRLGVAGACCLTNSISSENKFK